MSAGQITEASMSFMRVNKLHRRKLIKQPQLTVLDRLNYWTTTKLKKVRRGQPVAVYAPLET